MRVLVSIDLRFVCPFKDSYIDDLVVQQTIWKSPQKEYSSWYEEGYEHKELVMGSNKYLTRKNKIKRVFLESRPTEQLIEEMLETEFMYAEIMEYPDETVLVLSRESFS